MQIRLTKEAEQFLGERIRGLRDMRGRDLVEAMASGYMTLVRLNGSLTATMTPAGRELIELLAEDEAVDDQLAALLDGDEES
jgi:hypothetical protein